MVFLVDILKISLPLAVALGAVFLIIKRYLDSKQNLRLIKENAKQRTNALALRLQACERMVLFCERIAPPTLLLRLRTEAMTANDLKSAMILAIQQEWEHNLTQQIYLSGELWQILDLAKNEVSAFISLAAKGVSTTAPSIELANEIFAKAEEHNSLTILEKAKAAIRHEARSALGL